MFGANFVHPSTVEYLAGGYSPGGIPNYAAQTPGSIQSHIQTTAYKRIATLSYIQDAYESKVHWYNTIHMSDTDISRMSYFEPSKLTRRAHHFLVLGLSLPAILDLNNSNVLDYLRALNALLLEFDAFQHARPAQGPATNNGSTSSLAAARMKIPQMFKRNAHATHSANAAGNASGGKRRVSTATATAAEAGVGASPSLASSPSWPVQAESQQGGDYLSSGPLGSLGKAASSSNLALASITAGSGNDGAGTTSANAAGGGNNANPQRTSPSFAPGAGGGGSTSTSNLLPGEQYAYLLTPSVPFDPDFFQTFATLCDVLIAAYSRLAALTASMASCTPVVGELFVKADAKIKRVILGTVVKEFEEVSRRQVKNEILGVSKIILAGS